MIWKELFQIFARCDAVGEGKDVVWFSMSLEVRDICSKTSDVMWKWWVLTFVDDAAGVGEAREFLRQHGGQRDAAAQLLLGVHRAEQRHRRACHNKYYYNIVRISTGLRWNLT